VIDKPRKQIHLGAHFPGVDNGQIEFDSFVHFARTAERGLFDFFFFLFFLDDLDAVDRPDTFTILAALAAVTDRLGLAGTISTTLNEPFEVARQFATLDHLSDGRAASNLVTSSDAFTGANFRRGGYLAHDDRYLRAEEFLTVARAFWDSWAADAIVADEVTGNYVDPDRVTAVAHHGAQFDVRGLATLHEAGAVILFAAPGFYHGATTIDDLVDFVVARVLDQIGIDQALTPRWGQS